MKQLVYRLFYQGKRRKEKILTLDVYKDGTIEDYAGIQVGLYTLDELEELRKNPSEKEEYEKIMAYAKDYSKKRGRSRPDDWAKDYEWFLTMRHSHPLYYPSDEEDNRAYYTLHEILSDYGEYHNLPFDFEEVPPWHKRFSLEYFGKGEWLHDEPLPEGVIY